MRPQSLFSKIALIAFLVVMAGCKSNTNQLNMEGKALFEQGQYSHAINRFQQALKANPRDANAYYNLAATYHRGAIQTRDAQTVAQADSFYRQALELNPNHVEANRGLGVLLIGQNRQSEAFNLIRDWMNRNPNSPDPRIELARLYHEFGDRDTATQLLSDSLNIDYRNARALRALGRIREEKGELAQAISNYQRSYQSNSSQNDLLGRIATLQQRIAANNTNNTRVGGSGTNSPR